MSDTSDERVIGYAKWNESEAKSLRLHCADSPSMPELAEMHEETAATLRALLAERDAALTLLHRAMRHIERVSVMLNDISAAVHRLDDAEPEGSTRFDAMSALLVRRFTDCSGLPLIHDADNAGLLPDDLKPAATEAFHE